VTEAAFVPILGILELLILQLGKVQSMMWLPIGGGHIMQPSRVSFSTLTYKKTL